MRQWQQSESLCGYCELLCLSLRNFKLLSFGDEVEEEEEDLSAVQVKSSGKSAHDLARDEKLSSEPAVRKEELMRDEVRLI